MHRSADPLDQLWRDIGTDLLRYATVLVGPDAAADVVDDTFVRLLTIRMREPQRTFERAYVFRIVLNEARMWHRSRGRRERREWAASRSVPPQAEMLADPSVLKAVGRLSVMQRAVVYLTYWEDLPVAAVAHRLEVREGTVRRHLARARANLRGVL